MADLYTYIVFDSHIGYDVLLFETFELAQAYVQREYKGLTIDTLGWWNSDNPDSHVFILHSKYFPDKDVCFEFPFQYLKPLYTTPYSE